MNKTMDEIYGMNPNQWPENVRLLVSQLIQDFAIMFTNIYETEPEVTITNLAKSWLDFNAEDIHVQLEQVICCHIYLFFLLFYFLFFIFCCV